jgi:alpha-tubulin suppressor-like RCC1 family protein
VLETLTDIEAIVAGAYTSLALDKNGSIYIWGQNLNFSRVGPDNRTAKLILTPQIFPYLNDVNQIAICNLTAYALVENGWPYGWGMCDEGGQLGARRRYPSSMPNQILGPPPLEYIATGDTHVLGLDKDGVLWTWGDNSFGQRGMTSYEYTANPTILRLPFSCLAIAAGKDHSLVLSQDGDVFAWGRSPTGEAGEINDHERLTNFRPQKIKGLPKISSIATGNFCSFAKSDNKEIWGWGEILVLFQK